MSTFIERAIEGVRRSIPVIPVEPGSKATHIGTKAATLDSAVITQWNIANPNYNCGLVAQAKPGGVWILDCDSPEVAKEFEKSTGQPFPRTFAVQSSSGGHRYFRQNQASLTRLRNFSVSRNGKEFFSVRFDSMYCVGPLSVHETTGKIYTVVADVDPIEAPDFVIDWLLAQAPEQSKYGFIVSDERDEHGLISHGSIHNHLVVQAGKLRQQGYPVEAVEVALLAWAHENCAPPLDEAKIIQVARSSKIWPQGDPSPQVLLGGREPGMGGSSAGSVAQPQTEDGDEPQVETESPELLPEFPPLTGSLADLADVLCPSIPVEFKLMAAITFWGLIRSGLDTLANEPNLQPRFYACFVSDPWRGKSAAINEVSKIMSGLSTRFSHPPSVDSGPALVDEFAEQSDKMKASLCDDRAARVLIVADEIKDLFEKAKVSPQSKNSLFTEMLKLFEGNVTGNRSRANGKIYLENAHLGIVGGATLGGYQTMWTGSGGASSGLQSRITVIGTNADPMPAQQEPTDGKALVEVLDRLREQVARPAQQIKFTPEASDLLDKWWGSSKRDQVSEARIVDIVKRLLIVLAVTNDTDVIDAKLMSQGIAFGDYEIAMREHFNPPDSYSWCQAFENAIINVLHKNKVPMTANTIRRFVHPERKPGGFGPFLQAFNNLLKAGVIRSDGKSERSPKYVVAGAYV